MIMSKGVRMVVHVNKTPALMGRVHDSIWRLINRKFSDRIWARVTLRMRHVVRRGVAL